MIYKYNILKIIYLKESDSVNSKNFTNYFFYCYDLRDVQVNFITLNLKTAVSPGNTDQGGCLFSGRAATIEIILPRCRSNCINKMAKYDCFTPRSFS